MYLATHNSIYYYSEQVHPGFESKFNNTICIYYLIYTGYSFRSYNDNEEQFISRGLQTQLLAGALTNPVLMNEYYSLNMCKY